MNPDLLLSTSRAQLARLPALLEGLLSGLDLADWRARPAPREGA